MNTIKIKDVTPENVAEETLFCVKDITSPAFESKRKWFVKRYEEGLRMKILKENADRMIGFVEYIPAFKAWRPICAKNFMFILYSPVFKKRP